MPTEPQNPKSLADKATHDLSTLYESLIAIARRTEEEDRAIFERRASALQALSNEADQLRERYIPHVGPESKAVMQDALHHFHLFMGVLLRDLKSQR